MINKHIEKLCKNYTEIENYEQAVSDNIRKWHCHHRLGTHFSDGTPRPKNAQLTRDELKKLDMYYSRPASELIFLLESEHHKLHQMEKSFSNETKEKQSVSHKGKTQTEESNKKRAEKLKGIKRSEETKQRMSKSKKGNKYCLGRKDSEETKQKRKDYFTKMCNAYKHSNPLGLGWNAFQKWYKNTNSDEL